jgi:hypothetical protein
MDAEDIAYDLRELANQIDREFDGKPTAPPGLSEPPAEAWVEIDGHQWATDGHCAVRRDGPRPGRATVWRTNMTAESIGSVLASHDDVGEVLHAPNWELLSARSPTDAYPGAFAVRNARTDEAIGFDAWARALVWGCGVRVKDALNVMSLLGPDGSLVAVAIPLRLERQP